MYLSLSAVGLRTALRYRKNWDRNSPIVKRLQSFMPKGKGKLGYRLYLDVNNSSKRFTVPPAVEHALHEKGFVVTDYRAKKCVKVSDKEQKNVYNIGKIIADDVHAKMAFDNDPQLQNSNAGNVRIVISCHPYDIIGMSTGRDWDQQSCMRLADKYAGTTGGSGSHALLSDVAYGTLVAYAIRETDDNIEHPLCRVLLKPFISDEDRSNVLYRMESNVYGNPVHGFRVTVASFLRKFNAHVKGTDFQLAPGVYNDGLGGSYSRADEIESADKPVDEVHSANPIVNRVRDCIQSGNYTQALYELYECTKFIDDESREALEKLVVRAAPKLRQVFHEVTPEGHAHPIAIQLFRAAGLLKDGEKEATDMLERAEVSSNLASFLQASYSSELGQRILFSRLEKFINTGRGVSRLEKRHSFSAIIAGSMFTYDKELFREYPALCSVLHTMASALRWSALWGNFAYMHGLHKTLRIVSEFPKNKDYVFLYGNVAPTVNKGAACLVLQEPASSIHAVGINMRPFLTRRAFRALCRVYREDKEAVRPFFIRTVEHIITEDEDLTRDVKGDCLREVEEDPTLLL